MTLFLSIFILLSVLVIIHELGHFWVAKRSGMLVEEFGFFLPPRLFGIKIGETIYSINLLPFGGFVRILGEDGREKVDSRLKHRTFAYKPWYQRGAVIIAGPIMNFLLALVIISYLFNKGVFVPTNQVRVVEIAKNSPAHKAGLQKNDLLLSIRNGGMHKLTSVTTLVQLSKDYKGKEMLITYERNGEQYSVALLPRQNPPEGEGALGVIVSDVQFVQATWYQAPLIGLRESLRISWLFYKELGGVVGRLITLQKPGVEVAGPVGIARMAKTAAEEGVESFLQLMGLLSLNLALINILPFPALDGGQLSFVVYEAVTRKRLSEELKVKINTAGFIMLLFLLLTITTNDILKIIR